MLQNNSDFSNVFGCSVGLETGILQSSVHAVLETDWARYQNFEAAVRTKSIKLAISLTEGLPG